MTALLHPGVYVQEIPSGLRVVEGVPTSTTIFVGETERGPVEPTKIKGVVDYERLFGGYLRTQVTGEVVSSRRVTMRYAIGAFFANGGSSAYVLRSIGPTAGTSTRTIGDAANPPKIAAASPGAWPNGRLYVIIAHTASKPHATPAPTTADVFRLLVFYRPPAALPSGPAELVEDWDRLNLDAASDNYVETVLRRSNFIRWIPGVLTNNVITVDLPLVRRPSDVKQDDLTAERTMGPTGTLGVDSLAATDLDTILRKLDGVDDAALVVSAPDEWLSTLTDDPAEATLAALHGAIRSYVDNRPKLDLFYVADLPRQHDPVTGAVAATATLVRSATGTSAPFTSTSSMMGWYWPHLKVADPVGQGRDPIVLVPPAGAIAGLYARTDGRRGVWKAPAGTESTLNGIVGVQHELLDAHQDDLNELGVNCIRPIPGAGIVSWGARTTVPKTEWRYVPVRRTAMFLRKSIYNGIQWAVFEPNNQELWRALRVSIGAFMETQYRNGAFAGATSKDAYFVKCDDETTNEIDQANGVVNVLVGFAPLRPAEFVVVKLSQITKLTA